MIKKIWFTRENLEKSEILEGEVYPIPKFVKFVRDQAMKEGYDMSLKEAVDLCHEVRRSVCKDDDINHYLILPNNTGAGPSIYYKLNPDFDWAWYKANHVDKCYDEEMEFELLKSIAIEIHDRLGSTVNGKACYSNHFTPSIAKKLEQWDDKFYKG